MAKEEPVKPSSRDAKVEDFKSIDQQAQEQEEKMRQQGAHSNIGVGDEKNPIGESEEG